LKTKTIQSKNKRVRTYLATFAQDYACMYTYIYMANEKIVVNSFEKCIACAIPISYQYKNHSITSIISL
jgi:hypothetical protein